MVDLITLTNSNELDFQIQNIYTEAFPIDERRDLEGLKKQISNPLVKIHKITFNDQLAGLIIIWNLETFSFIEHFAIEQTMRGKGIGSVVINQIRHHLKSIIIEVELPFTDLAGRRIKFYKNAGFHVHSGNYFQPPYHSSTNAVKMLLMSYPKPISQHNFESVKELIHQKVYNSPTYNQ
jgi:GNAT superfamily N-acetyltransferase